MKYYHKLWKNVFLEELSLISGEKTFNNNKSNRLSRSILDIMMDGSIHK